MVTFGIDVGTTSVAGIAVDASGRVVASATRAHEADVPGTPPGVDEQDPRRLLDASVAVVDALTRAAGPAAAIGWTGQMHGVVAVDAALEPVTNFVTWRDARRYGGRVMRDWARQGLEIHKCLCAPGYVSARLGGRLVMDATFYESWHVEEGAVPAAWLPEVAGCPLLGDNQAGVFAAQRLSPGAAVVNLGTSGQLSLVLDAPPAELPVGVETRRYPGGKTLLCRASLVGGQAWKALQRRLGIPWDELNARAETDAEIRACAEGIVDDLLVGMDVSAATGLVGVGNALRMNPALRRAVERRFGRTCLVPGIDEMAAYGAAMFACGAE